MGQGTGKENKLLKNIKKEITDVRVRSYVIAIFILGLFLGVFISLNNINSSKNKDLVKQNQEQETEVINLSESLTKLKRTLEIKEKDLSIAEEDLQRVRHDLYLIDMYNEREKYMNENEG